MAEFLPFFKLNEDFLIIMPQQILMYFKIYKVLQYCLSCHAIIGDFDGQIKTTSAH